MLWDRWIDLWNGDLDLAQEIIDPDLAIHRFPPPRIADHLHGREALLAWIKQTRSLFGDLRLRVEVGPIVDREAVAGRWVVEGRYVGGIPGSTVPAGTPVRFHGNDIWRSEGMVRRWWLRSQEAGWRRRAAINGIGAVTTGAVAVEVAAAKFALGAWIVLILIPLLVAMTMFIERHTVQWPRRLPYVLTPTSPGRVGRNGSSSRCPGSIGPSSRRSTSVER